MTFKIQTIIICEECEDQTFILFGGTDVLQFCLILRIFFFYLLLGICAPNTTHIGTCLCNLSDLFLVFTALLGVL